MRDQGAVVGRAHLDNLTLLQPLPIQKQAVGRNRSQRHLGHSLPLSSAIIHLRFADLRFASDGSILDWRLTIRLLPGD
jgi:hypothetical protein